LHQFLGGNQVGKRLQSPLPGDCGLGAPLRLERQVEVFQFGFLTLLICFVQLACLALAQLGRRRVALNMLLRLLGLLMSPQRVRLFNN